MISENLVQFVENVNIETGYRTDHSLLTLSIKYKNIERGKTFWKFNNSLLKDPNYVITIKNTIKRVKQQYMIPVYNLDNIDDIDLENLEFLINDQLFLETLLMEIRASTISYASFKKRSRVNREKILIERINENEKCLLQDEGVRTTLENDRTELENIRKHKMEGIQIRSRARWIQEGEKVSKYFCHLENRNFISKTMTKLINEKGEEIEDVKEIVSETKHFYENLYSSREDKIQKEDLNTLIKDKNIPKLSYQEQRVIEGKISYKEALNALKKMSNNKSPGTSGYTVEFFKFFWVNLGHFLVRSINYSYIHKQLSNTQKQGLITCIPKGNKSKAFLKNWRPISLLNVEYKIASACIAERIKTTLPKIINEDQTGFIQGRYIGENIRQVYDVMNYTEKNKCSGMILLVDFEKAFDSVSWSFIQKVLQFFNFGPSIQSWVYTFYNNISSCVQVNGHISEWFQIKRGCRQGDPLSPYIFLLCAEILAILARGNKEIKGINIENIIYLISQYADDTSFTLDGSKKSLEETLKLLIFFSKISGLCINIEKTKVIWIGRKKNSNTRYCEEYKLEWNPKTFTLLGIKFSVNLHEMISINYEEKIKEIEKLMVDWSRRILTPVGRITVIKTLALSKLNHLFSALPNPPEPIIQKLNKLFFKFIWQKSVDRIKRTVLCQDYKDGGIRMTNIKTFIHAMKISWIRRTVFSKCKWLELFKSMFPDYRLLYYGGAIPKQCIINQQNKFWLDVFDAWNILLNNSKTIEDITCECLWNNTNIKVGNKSIFYRHWFERGVQIIDDLLTETGFISYNDFVVKFGIQNNFLQFQGIIRSIKTYIRKQGLLIVDKKYIAKPFISPILLLLFKTAKGCRHVYDVINKMVNKPKSLEKWNRDIRNISDSEWKYYLKIPYKITKDSRLHWFQVRILHRILTTNKFMFMINRRDNNVCTFCKLEPETIVHLFWECPQAIDLWTNIFQWLNLNHLCSDFTFSLETIILGTRTKSFLNTSLNLILLLVKFYIYRCKVNQTDLSLIHIQREISRRYRLEKYIATINNDMEKFEKHWKDIGTIISSIITTTTTTTTTITTTTTAAAAAVTMTR